MRNKEVNCDQFCRHRSDAIAGADSVTSACLFRNSTSPITKLMKHPAESNLYFYKVVVVVVQIFSPKSSTKHDFKICRRF